MSRDSIIYIDGFNLYYGALQYSRAKWLNLELLFQRLRQDDEIQAIKFFTALIGGPRKENQATYLEALSTCPLVEVILGKFKRKQFTCRVRGAAVELRNSADRHRTLPMELIKKSQFPERISDGMGGWITKPADW